MLWTPLNEGKVMLVGGGGTTASSKYKYSDQALNYEYASDAMYSMYKRVSLSNYSLIDDDSKLISRIMTI